IALYQCESEKALRLDLPGRWCNRGRQFIVPPWDRGCYCNSDLTVPAPPHPSPITHPPKITKHTLTLWADRLWQLTDPVCAACVCVCESLCVCVWADVG